MDKLGNFVHLTLPPEDDDGAIEYKWNLAKINSYKRNKLTSQMRWRVHEAAEDKSALYILGVHDNGQVTGLPRSDLVATFINLMDCAHRVGLYTCLRVFGPVGKSTDRYWAIMQVFWSPIERTHIQLDCDIPKIPTHIIPDYLTNK